MKFVRGDVVLKSEPYAVVVDEVCFKDVCSLCLTKSNQLSACTKCHHLYYCSDTCQISDWPAHQDECEIFAKMPKDFLPNCYTRLLARCLQRRERDPDFSEEVLGVVRTAADWVHHDEAKNDIEFMEFFGERYLELRSYFKLQQVLPDDVLKMFLKLWVNCQSIGGQTSVGLAVYLGQSAIDHSCVRDKRYTHFFFGTTFVVKALEEADLTLDDIRIEYRNILQPKEYRQKELARWYFVCVCSLCSGRVAETITNPTPEKLDEISQRVQDASDSNEIISILESHVDSKLDKLCDYVQLECAWSLGFRYLPEASRYTDAVPYLKAILKIVEEVYGKDDFYFHTLRRVQKVCKPSEEAMQMIGEERAEIQQLESFFVL